MIRVGDHRELQAAVLAMKAADKDLRRAINDSTRQTMNPEWKKLVAEHSDMTTVLGAQVLNKGVRVAAGNPVQLVAASSTRGIGDGKRVKPADLYHAFEFGADPNHSVQYQRTSRSGKKHTVTRHVSRQLPQRRRTGRVVWPAAEVFIPRAISLWLHIIVKKYAEAAEGNQV